MCKAGLSACWEHFHLWAACAAEEGEVRVWGGCRAPSPEHCKVTELSRIWSIVPGKLQGKARNQGNSLLDWESHIATEARLNAYQM